MILHHGSNVGMREPKLLRVQRDLYFRKGFYMTGDYDQASRWMRQRRVFPMP